MTITASPTLEISVKQFNLIRELATEKPTWPTKVDGKVSRVIKIVTRFDPQKNEPMMFISRFEASKAISALFKVSDGDKIVALKTNTQASLKVLAQESIKNLPASYKGTKYAIKNTDPNSPNEYVFYEIVERKSGRYVNRLQGAPGSWHRIFVKYADYAGIAQRIQEAWFTDDITGELLTGPKAAAFRYCKMYKRCTSCDAELSNNKSISQAMGPVCAKKFN